MATTTWLQPASISMLVATAILAATFSYLYFSHRERHLVFWTLAFLFSTVRYLLFVAQTSLGKSLFLSIGYNLSTVLAGTMMVCGARAFSDRRVAGAWISAAVATGIWGVAAPFGNLSGPTISIPIFLLLGTAYISIGAVLLGSWPRPRPPILVITATLFVLWGLHQYDYPVLRFVDWFAPIGYLIGGSFALATAVGVVLVYFERARLDALRSRGEYKELFEASPYGIGLADPSTGMILEVNRALASMVGATREELIGQPQRVLHPPSEREEDGRTRTFREHLGEGRGLSLQSQIVTRDGASRDVEIKCDFVLLGGRQVVQGFFSDITERLRAETSLRESEERERLRARDLETILDALPAAVWIAHDPDCSVITGNRAAAELLGLPRDANMSLSVGDESSPRRVRVLREGVELAPEQMPVQRAARGERISSFEFDFRFEDGTTRHMLGNAAPLLDLAGVPRGAVASFVDITLWREALEEMSRLQLQLAHSQKMEAIGRLAGGVAHDFNNMLGVILGYSDLLLSRPQTDPRTRAELEQIKGAAERSAGITSQLLAFARKQVAKPEVLDLNEAVGGIVGMLRRLIGEDIELTWHPKPGVGSVTIDPSQLDQILANLAANARDAITGTGRVRIETEDVGLDAEDCRAHPGVTPGRYVRLSVSDDGCGIPEQELPNVFEPFYTTKARGQGTGLGLATVFGIVKQNGGYIDVCSQAGRGSTFSVYLPRRAEGSPPSTAGTVERQDVSGTETILLVEDEAAILTLTATILKNEGYAVLEADTPAAALALADEFAGPIDLLVTDVVMPGMNGKELFERLVEKRPSLRSLYVSGYTADIIAGRGVVEEGVAFLPKPFRPSDLAAKVRQVLDR